MRVRLALGAMMGGVLLSAIAVTGIASAARGNNLICSGGDFATGTFTPITSGDYSSITVTGACQVQAGAVVDVTGNINVTAGAVLDAQSYSSTITVGHNVTAEAGSFLGLGCQPSGAIGRFAGVPCIDDPNRTVITVNGNITATNAALVLVRGATVNGNVTVDGGSSDQPWSIKGDTIGGNLTI